MKRLELLAPAGSLEALKAAIDAGADSVYFGGKSFSARASARNLTTDEIRAGTDYAHLFKAKAYAAVNTLIKNSEFKEALHHCARLYEIGVDAIICQDIGLASAIHESYPEIELHASTQMTVHNSGTLKSLSIFDRFIMARELTLAELKKIKERTDKELEVFAHGALCVSYSGQCLMSSFMGGRSANRGRCAQPCRLSYGKGKGLSTSDLCAVQLIPEIAAAGVSALKIEGRMKPPEYVRSVVQIYRNAIDSYHAGAFEVSDKDLGALDKLFHRELCTGYIGGKRSILSGANSKREPFYPPIGPGRKVDVAISIVGDVIHATGERLKSSARLPRPLGKEISPQEAILLLEKDTPFRAIIHSQTRLHENQIAAAKPMLMRGLFGFSSSSYRRKWKEPILKPAAARLAHGRCNLHVRVQGRIDAERARTAGADYVYLNVFDETYESGAALPEIPAILNESQMEAARKAVRQSDKSVLTGNPGALEWFFAKAHLDYSFNLFNDTSIAYWNRLGIVSPELSLTEIRNLARKDIMVMAHGRVALMKTKETFPDALIDRHGRQLPIRQNPAGYTEIMNSVPLGLFNQTKLLMNAGIRHFFLDIEDDCKRTVQAYRSILDGREVRDSRLRRGHTTGHLFRGVE